MKPLIFSIGLIPLVCAAQVRSAIVMPASEQLREAEEKYRTCAALSLPDNFSRIHEPRMAAERALDQCHKKRLALAGQFALDNPGTRRTGEYIEDVRVRLTGDLATWIADMKTLGVQGPR
ncbi:hypothetical protein [Xylophilus sp. GOD-11R]|uniref:hypothetical protein n=1 Tax=Xylophilus sp. GOD-11R TaxID=3089814 RepID=UPI00298BD001|nr:hypothetical protein [Xylophilus sp. GOD-11R]WPB58815.1 hypothetical protein R9X41_09320 [Xylophilus sp. GOD-11R]